MTNSSIDNEHSIELLLFRSGETLTRREVRELSEQLDSAPWFLEASEVNHAEILHTE